MDYGFLNQVHAQNDKLNMCINCESLGHTVDGFSGFHAPITRTYLNGSQTISDSTYTALSYGADFIDPANQRDAGQATRLVARTPGLYQITAQAEFVANATGTRIIRITKNGTAVGRSERIFAPDGTIVDAINTEAIGEATVAGDYFEVEVRQNSGGNLNINDAGTSVMFIMFPYQGEGSGL